MSMSVFNVNVRVLCKIACIVHGKKKKKKKKKNNSKGGEEERNNIVI